jgi:drug/metabolite transporter (DMT)-like permease
MSRDQTRHPIKAAVMLFIATSVWGASFLAMKALGQKQQGSLPEAGTGFVTSLSLLVRFGVSAILVGLWTGRKLREASRLEMWQGAGLGFFGGFGILLQMDGVQHTAASTAAFLTQCYCVFIPIVLACHRRKIPGPRLIASCAMVMVGVAALANIDWNEFRLGRGEIESILGSILFTGQILWLERPVFQSNRNAVTTFVMFATVALLVFPVVLLTGTGMQECLAAYASWPAIVLGGFLTLGGTLAAYAVMNYWQPHLPATQAGLIYCCEPLFTSVFALFLPGWLSAAFQIHYPNEAVTVRLLVGGGLITAANLLAMWPIPRPSPLASATGRAA